MSPEAYRYLVAVTPASSIQGTKLYFAFIWQAGITAACGLQGKWQEQNLFHCSCSQKQWDAQKAKRAAILIRQSKDKKR